MESAKEKIKNQQRFLYWPKPIYTCQKRNLTISWDTLFKLQSYPALLCCILVLHSYPSTPSCTLIKNILQSSPALLPCTLFLHSDPVLLSCTLIQRTPIQCTRILRSCLFTLVLQFYPSCLFCTPILHFYSALLTPINICNLPSHKRDWSTRFF